MNLYRLLGIVIGILLSCCKPVELGSAEELIRFVDEPANNLSRRMVVNGVVITVTYMPADLMIYQEINGQPTDHKRIRHLLQKYEGQYHFKVSLSRDNHDVLSQLGSDQHERLLSTLSYSMQDFIHLTTSSDEVIPVAESVLHRKESNAEKSTDVLFVCGRQKAIGEDWIKVNIREFGLGLGKQEFSFKVEDLEDVPRIKFPIVS